jgi:hypothetical protein
VFIDPNDKMIKRIESLFTSFERLEEFWAFCHVKDLVFDAKAWFCI